MKTEYIKAARVVAQRFANCDLPYHEHRTFKNRYGEKGIEAAQRFAKWMGVEPFRIKALSCDF